MRSEATSVISWTSQLNASASFHTKPTDEYINIDKVANNQHESPSTQGKKYVKQPSVTTMRNLSSQRKIISNLVPSAEIQSSEIEPRESKSQIGEDSNRKNNIKQKSRLKPTQKAEQPFGKHKLKKITLFDYIQPRITNYFQTKNESQSSRFHTKRNRTLATEMKKDNFNLTGIDTIEENNVQGIGTQPHRFTPTHDQTQSREGRNNNHAFDGKIFSGTYGHALEEIDLLSTLCIVLQNPNGLNPKRDSDFLTCTRTCDEVSSEHSL